MELGSAVDRSSSLLGGMVKSVTGAFLDEADDNETNLVVKHIWRTDHANLVRTIYTFLLRLMFTQHGLSRHITS